MKALVVIDVQQGLFQPEPRPGGATAVLERIDALATRARAEGAPVIFVQHETQTDELPHGSEAWALAEGLATAPSDYFVYKTTPDAFLGTSLRSVLERVGSDHLVICGYATEFCIDTSVRRAAGLGYAVTLASDAHTTHAKPHASAEQIITHHNATLPSMESFGVPIAATPSEAVNFN